MRIPLSCTVNWLFLVPFRLIHTMLRFRQFNLASWLRRNTNRVHVGLWNSWRYLCLGSFPTELYQTPGTWIKQEPCVRVMSKFFCELSLYEFHFSIRHNCMRWWRLLKQVSLAIIVRGCGVILLRGIYCFGMSR